MMWVTVGALAVNLGLAGFSAFQIRRQARLIWLWSDLDALLATMAMESLQNHYLPMWAAWCGIMGDIEVSITSKRRRETID